MMNKEYIEREAIINTFCEDCERHSDENPFACSMCEDVKEIMKIPAADVAPVRHGHWNERKKYSKTFETNVVLGYQCSLCDFKLATTTNYCPNCGADMRGVHKNVKTT